jgi:hypothetical protein
MGGWQTWGAITTDGVIQQNRQDPTNRGGKQYHQHNQHEGWDIENRHNNILL